MISVTDSSDGLSVHHYADCDIDSPNDIKQTRGIIKESLEVRESGEETSSEVVCKSFPFTPELRTNDERLASYFDEYCQRNESFKTFEGLEGTLLRIWFREKTGEWYLSTHRKLDAFLSRWSSDYTYGELFVNVLKDAETKERYPLLKDVSSFEAYSKLLDPKRIYLILLRSSKANRVVCKTQEKNSIYIVGYFDRHENFNFHYGEEVSEAVFEPIPELTAFSGKRDLTEITQYVNTINPFHMQGVILISPSGDTLKILNTEYEDMVKLRGNVPNVLLRYIQLRSGEPAEAIRFQELYNDFLNEFLSFERVIQEIIVNIHKKYVIRYVHRKVAIVPPEQFKIMSELHQEYLSTRRVVTNDVISAYLKKQTAGKLMFLYSKFIQREKEWGNGNFVTEEERSAIQYNPNKPATVASSASAVGATAPTFASLVDTH